MRPTFMGFETARRGVMLSQKGLDITGHNMANVGSTGYTRQRMDLYAVATNRYASRFATSKVGLAGQGVDCTGISQVRDSFLDKRFREEYSDTNYYDQSAAILADIETALDEFDQDMGLENAIKEISNALSDFSKEGDEKTHANILRTAFENMTQTLHQMDTKLKNVIEQQKYNLEVSVTDANAIMEKIAHLNEAIVQDMSVTKASNGEYYGPNELLDERNLLLDQLAGYGGLDVEKLSDGSVTVSFNGKKVVEGNKYDMINYSRHSNGTVELRWQSDGKEVSTTEKTGSLAASVELLNGRGVNAKEVNENISKGVRYYQDRLDTFANTFAKIMNNVIPKLAPDTGNRTLLESNEKVPGPGGTFTTAYNKPITAENITISRDWQKDSTYVIYEPGNTDNTYINKMRDLLVSDESISFTPIGGLGESFKGTFEEYVKDTANTYAAQKKFNDDRLTVTMTSASDMMNRRDEVSGVSYEEETTNMLMYSKSMQASSRMMNAMDDALDLIINRTGRVGL